MTEKRHWTRLCLCLCCYWSVVECGFTLLTLVVSTVCLLLGEIRWLYIAFFWYLYYNHYKRVL